MSNFGVTTAVTRLAQALIREGYQGTVTLTNSYATGTKAVLNECFSLELTGFCKETAYLVQDLKDSEIGVIGRFGTLNWYGKCEVKDLADLAWDTYQKYKSEGFSRPTEWEKIWVKYGYLTPKTTTILVEKE